MDFLIIDNGNQTQNKASKSDFPTEIHPYFKIYIDVQTSLQSN